MIENQPRRRLLVTGFRPGPGGVGRVMQNLIGGLAKAGIEVHVLVGRGDYPALEQAPHGVLLHRVPNKFGDKAAVPAVRALLEALSPPVVLCNRDDASGLIIASRQGLTPAPQVLLRIGIHVPTKLRSKNPFARWRSRRQLTRTYRAADLLIANSRGVAKGLRELLGDTAPPIEVLLNPVDLQRCRRLACAEPSHPWFTERRGPLLVSVGRLARMKDQGTMLRALALLPPSVRLVIFGEGRQRRRLAALAERLGIAQRVDLPGFSDNPFAPFAHVGRADAFVLSSRFEGSPNAQLEALAVGAPAIATDCPSGPREILDDGRYGPLVPIGNPRALADAILATLENPPAAALLDEAAERYRIDQAVRAYLQVMGLAEHAGQTARA
jgi:glycosyltransferase involved in cell wall biosynthesis